MTEQEQRAEFCKRIGRVATLAAEEYFAFCEGVKFGRNAIPNLQAVIQWLENGCEPKEAAKELRMYQSLRSNA